MKMLGVILLIIGAVALLYGGFRDTTQKPEVKMGPLEITKAEHHTVLIPPLVGLVCVTAGGVLMLSASRAGR